MFVVENRRDDYYSQDGNRSETTGLFLFGKTMLKFSIAERSERHRLRELLIIANVCSRKKGNVQPEQFD